MSVASVSAEATPPSRVRIPLGEALPNLAPRAVFEHFHELTQMPRPSHHEAEVSAFLAAFGGGNIIEQPNLFFAVAIVQPGKTPEEAADALIAELDKLKKEPITAGELQQAKNQFARDYIFGRESNKDKALQLGHAAVIHDDIKTADGEFDIFMNIAAADVQRVAVSPARGIQPFAIVVDDRGAVDDLVAPVAIDVGHRELVVSLAAVCAVLL